MSVSVVVDASAFLALVLPDSQENKSYAIALTYAAEAKRIDLIAPHLAHHEIAAKLIRRVRSHNLSRTRAMDFFENLAEIPIQTELDFRDMSSLFEDAHQFGCGGFDAVYVRTALAHGALLATLDQKLVSHMRRAGVDQWQP